ncbi:MAG: sigma-70 family RNA polymerase sigma factor [Prevotella sp.]|jgi:RNA polymerase sigma factor (sigma-70 family)|nr:sigma-70 family RNA polymerase sigma factor [Prevotella sp.]MDR2005275.1 sigma-70 family RNA polymerase sigma factor [Prevotella sp.]
MSDKNISDDELLWNNFLSGSEDAYSLIYKKYSKRLVIQGLQFTADKELIKDTVHDVFVKIYKNRIKLVPVSNIKVYLFIALRNSIITSLKKRRERFCRLDEMLEDLISTDNSIEEEYIKKECRTETQQLIGKILLLLTIRQREVIHYRFFEGMSIDEISELMDMNNQSVQNLLQRSLKKINEFLKIYQKK